MGWRSGPEDKPKLALAISGLLIGEWFKEPFDKLFPSIRGTVAPHRKAKAIVNKANGRVASLCFGQIKTDCCPYYNRAIPYWLFFYL